MRKRFLPADFEGPEAGQMVKDRKGLRTLDARQSAGK
jgi:hypothetical protein